MVANYFNIIELHRRGNLPGFLKFDHLTGYPEKNNLQSILVTPAVLVGQAHSGSLRPPCGTRALHCLKWSRGTFCKARTPRPEVHQLFEARKQCPAPLASEANSLGSLARVGALINNKENCLFLFCFSKLIFSEFILSLGFQLFETKANKISRLTLHSSLTSPWH